MKAYLVETFTERFPGCGLLLGGRAVFSNKTKAKKFITQQKRKYSKQEYRIELWEILSRTLYMERLAELVITEDIWAYVVHRQELLEKHEKRPLEAETLV